jgi:2-polyprenyl-3-methyl-5-hydroxy-6-metoxy-1,4-benzoquinol methylase
MTPTDHGRPVPREAWDRQYRDGAFEFLDSIDELAHYVIIAGYVRTLFTRPAILDVGCGHGRLVEVLEGFPFKQYHGIDVSSEAIRRGERRATKKATFAVADFDAWNPPQRFDVIVFCESLNYARHPASTLLRYARALERSGAIIVSLFRYRKPGGLGKRTWKNIEAHFGTVDSTTVTNHTGQTWDIKVLRQKTEEAN